MIDDLSGTKSTWRRCTRQSHRTYLLISSTKSTPPENRQLIVCYDWLKYYPDGFVGELTFQNKSIDTLCQIGMCNAGRPSAFRTPTPPGEPAGA